MLTWILAVLLFPLLANAADVWLQQVSPVMSKVERQRYLSLENEIARQSFREAYWSDKAIDASEYFSRLTFVDNSYGSGSPASGANTDQGRVYLALGPPTSVVRMPSSRIFVECEIWIYDHAPETGISTRLQLIFFRQRQGGRLRLATPLISIPSARFCCPAGPPGCCSTGTR